MSIGTTRARVDGQSVATARLGILALYGLVAYGKRITSS